MEVGQIKGLHLINDSSELDWELVSLEDGDSIEDHCSAWLAEWQELDVEDSEMDGLHMSPILK